MFLHPGSFSKNSIMSFKVIIAGTRTFTNLKLMEEVMDKLLINRTDVEIVSGTAQGADKTGEMYAIMRHYPIRKFPADWSQGKRAGYLRNEQMAKYADACVCFWDGKSRGTEHMINLAKQYGLKLRVIRYDNQK